MLAAFHDFVVRYHAEETLMFWVAVEVFKHRNWKAAKFFGMETTSELLFDTSRVQTPKRSDVSSKKSDTSTKKEIERRKSRKERNADVHAKQALQRQRQLDQSAANRMGVSLEQLYLVKEADFIFDTFIRRDGIYWTCMDSQIEKDIEIKLMDPASLTRNVFQAAQSLAFNGMNDDLIPRFQKELLDASELNPIPPELKAVCERFKELKSQPLRRKTGVSTALAFTLRRRTSEGTKKAAQLPSSREKGMFDPNNLSAKDPAKATNLLRQRSALAVLGPDGGSVGALGLSRSRLSSNVGELAQIMLQAQASQNSTNSKRSGIKLKTEKHVSTPNIVDRDSLSRKMEIGVHRTKSDFDLLSRGLHKRRKDFGLDDQSFNSRATVSIFNQTTSGDRVTLLLERNSVRGRENSV